MSKKGTKLINTDVSSCYMSLKSRKNILGFLIITCASMCFLFVGVSLVFSSQWFFICTMIKQTYQSYVELLNRWCFVLMINQLNLYAHFWICFLLSFSPNAYSFFTSRLYRITKRAGEKQGSGLMKANAWHHRADAISSVVALVGVGEALFFFFLSTYHFYSSCFETWI